MVITSVNNKHIKDIIKLRNKKYRDDSGFFLVETAHLVLEAINKGLVLEVIICDGYDFSCDVNKVYVSEEVMKKLSSTESNPKVMAVVNKIMEKELYGDKVIILDNIQDPGNLGAIIRSAVAFNFDTIVLGNTCVDLYNPKVIRASEGMIFKINIVRKNIIDYISDIKEKGYLVLGTDVNGGIDVRDINISSKYAFVIGNEGRGICKDVSKLCDKNVYIDINDNCESLNASVAASIIMYELNNK